MLNKSGRFKRGTYNPIRAAREHALTKVLIKNVSNEGNFRKWVEKMSERKGLPIYTAKSEFDPASNCMTLWFKNYKFYLNLVTLCKEHRYGTEFLSPVLLDAPAQNRSTVPGAAPAAAQPVAASANPTTAGPTSLSDVIKSTLVLPPDSLFTDYVKANYNPTICSISFNNLKTFTIGDRGYAINWNSVDTSKKVFNALKFHAIGCMEAYFEGLGMTTLSTLSRLYKCCPALMYLSVKNNQIQDVNEITKLHGLRLKGFGVDGNPIQASPEEINRIIRQTFPLIITGKMIQFPVFTFMSLQTLPQPKFNMVTKTDFPPSAEVTEINAIAEGFMKMFILNRFARPHIDEHYAPNATVSIIENRMYARRDALGRSGGTFFLNKEYTRGAENISHLLAQRLKGRFPITNSCYTIDYNVFAGCMCVLTICGFVRSTESAFTRTIVFGKDPASGKSLITNDIINIWVERGPNIISYLNPMSAISDRTTIEALSAAPPPPSAQAPLMTPEEAKYVEALSAASGLPIHVVTEYIQKSGKTREQVESDLSNPAFVNEIKARIQSLGL